MRAQHLRARRENGIVISLRQKGIGFAPFPLRRQAVGTAASAALRLGQGAGPKQNASRVLGR
jgi:hypothetical protein